MAEGTIVWIKREDGSREEWIMDQAADTRLRGTGQMRRVMVPNALFKQLNSLEFKDYLRGILNTIYADLCEIHQEVNR